MNNNKIAEELAKELDFILDATHDDLLIADGKGVVVKVNPTFEKVYCLKKEDAIGKTVYELEEEGYFKPSIVAKVLDSKEKVSLRQKNNMNRDILVTATPVFDQEKNIKFVISFSRDITEMVELQKNYSKLETKVQKYEAEIQELRSGEKAPYILGDSVRSRELVSQIKRVAQYDANVIFTGPSGVGKTFFAKVLHQSSGRNKGPFVEVNCAAIPENLLESELFGYEKGAFTGASEKGKIGFFELAGGGTLFLDEISEMPMSLQAKLLKVIQDKIVTKVGGVQGKKVDFRLIVATNKSLEEEIKEKRFRQDLYYRLNVITIAVPALTEIKEDIIPMCEYFLKGFNQKYNTEKHFSSKALKKLISYSWPGNVREVANIVERSAMLTGGNEIYEIYFESGNSDKTIIGKEKLDLFDSINLNEEMQRVEGDIIRKAWKQCGNSAEVARMLGISQPTAYRKIIKYIGDKEK